MYINIYFCFFCLMKNYTLERELRCIWPEHFCDKILPPSDSVTFCYKIADFKTIIETRIQTMNDLTQKILVVDDDQRLRDLLRRYLTEQGFSVETVADATAMDRMLLRNHYHLIVLDLMLPGEGGLKICQRLRNAGNLIPIIMLTAKGDEVDRIIGLEFGADDYLPKPFNPRELVARINAVLRRHKQHAPAGAPNITEQDVKFGHYTLVLATRKLFRDDEELTLTTGQFALLKLLVTSPRTPLSRATLVAKMSEVEHDASDRRIDVQVSRLRKLIEADPKNPRYLQTVWGHGYVFVPDEEPQ